MRKIYTLTAIMLTIGVVQLNAQVKFGVGAGLYHSSWKGDAGSWVFIRQRASRLAHVQREIMGLLLLPAVNPSHVQKWIHHRRSPLIPGMRTAVTPTLWLLLKQSCRLSLLVHLERCIFICGTDIEIGDAVRRLKYTYIVTGPISDLYAGSMASEPRMGSFDVAKKEATLLGDGKGPVSLIIKNPLNLLNINGINIKLRIFPTKFSSYFLCT